MDPRACLMEAEEFIRDGEYEEAGQRLRSYFSWRVGGGFEPKALRLMDGDDFYRYLIMDLCDRGFRHSQREA